MDIMIIMYRLKNFIFQWNAEEEKDGGSIVFTLFNRVHFLKYKESTIIYYGKGKYSQARKYVKAFQE